VYASVADLRDEGVSVAQASDARLLALIDEAGRAIDSFAGWFFEPRSLTLRLDGHGTPSIEPPVPPIELSALSVGGSAVSVAPEDLVIVGAPVQPGFDAPRITRTRKRVFPKSSGNVEAAGVWGYTEDDGTPHGRTPLEIRRACMLLVLRWLSPLAEGDSDARSRWRIIEERTRDQSYKLDRITSGIGGSFTGDPDIDGIVARYRRPPGLGAA
jgi:hypothetical protein